MQRRKFILSSALATAAATTLPLPSLFAGQPAARKFKIELSPGLIGVKANFAQTLDYAIQYGYEAIHPFTQEVMKEYSAGQLSEMLARMKAHNLSYGSINIPVEYRKDEAKFREDLKGLKAFCQTMEKQKASLINTWIFPSHPELTYNENMQQHGQRLGECAKIMKDHGIRLGLEYLGQRTTMNRNRYPFISTLKETKELIGAIGQPNVGIVLDSFHWYCADDTLADIRTLKGSEVTHVDLNDAREGFTRLTQVDGKRELPLATGVIPVKDFLQGLLDIGFAGPLRTEAFNQALNDMEDEEALKADIGSVRKALALVGV
jgi:sugar phosphate isomerase/epimerase